MANEAGKNERRLSITYWDGTNAVVDKSIAKAQELIHTENVRSNVIGTIEKRGGQVVIGTNSYGGRFSARENYDLVYTSTGKEIMNGLFRLSGSSEPSAILTISVFDTVHLIDDTSFTGQWNLKISIVEYLNLIEIPFSLVRDRNTFYIDNLDYSDVGIYRLDKNNKWVLLDDPNAHNIPAADFTHTVMDNKIFFANGRSNNFYLDTNSPNNGSQADGLNVLSSTLTQPNALGDLYNCPKAKIINAYKSRLYVANYDWEGVHYGTQLLTSSYPLGIVSIIQGDVTAPSGDIWVLPVTDNTYVYTDQYANQYEVWRINTKIADIKVSTMDDLNLYVADHDVTFSSHSGSGTVASTTSTSVTGLNVSTTLLNVGMGVAGTNIPAGTTIQSIDSSSSITLSQAATGPCTSFVFSKAATGTYLNNGGTATITGLNISTTLLSSGMTITASTLPAGTLLASILTANSVTMSSLATGSPTNYVFSLSATGACALSTTVTGLSVNASGLTLGMGVSGPLIPNGTTIASIVSDSSITLSQSATATGATTFVFAYSSFLSQDQIYVKGSMEGEKVYRWPNNPTMSGQDVKQYSTFKLSGSDESDITMCENVGNVMIIANRSILASWNDSIINYFDLGIGCVSDRGFIKAYGALYFIHYTGIYATSGGMPNIISSPIKPYLEGATKSGLENAVAGRKSRSVFFAIGDSKIYNPDGSVKRYLKDVCLEYHITQQNWYVHTGVPASAFETWIDEYDPSRLLFLDNKTKDVKAFLEGDSDDGAEIFFRADTNPLPIATNIEELSNPQLVIIESERGSSMECYVSIDGEEYYPLEGQAEKGITRLRFHGKDGATGSPPIGHYVALSFRDGSTQRCKIGRVAVTFVPTGTSNPN